LKRSTFRSFNEWAQNLNDKYPVHLDGHKRIETGSLVLNDPASAEGCLAIWSVSQNISDFETLFEG